MNRRSRTLGARWVFPVEGPPVRDAMLTIVDGLIVSIVPAARGQAETDLGNSAILPGFVNAHTHLELGSIDVADGGVEDEIPWLKRVIAQRMHATPESQHETISRNVVASIAAGTTLIADTATKGQSWPFLSRSPIRGIVFAEVIGLKRARGLQTMNDAMSWLATINPAAQLAASFRPGLSPHAPYSTAGWVYEKAALAGVPLSTHLAEMPEELEFLQTGAGPMRQFLEELGAWDAEWSPLSAEPSAYVRKGGLRNSDWLIAHGTYLDPECFWQLRPESAPSGERVAVVYCPRTHARFGHAPHPYRAILETGGIVCLGTDSLASSPSLSILDEVRFLHRRDPSLRGELLLAMATLFGAWAMRAETVNGSLIPGKSADLAIVSLPDHEADDPHSLLLDSDLPVVATMFEGQFVEVVPPGSP